MTLSLALAGLVVLLTAAGWALLDLLDSGRVVGPRPPRWVLCAPVVGWTLIATAGALRTLAG